MDLDDAFTKHSQWKVRLRTAIAQHATLDAHAIAGDAACDLGKWLHGDARSKYGHLAAYATCVAKHAAFHAEAGKVATAINARRYTEAEAALAANTPYAAASGAVGLAILTLKKEAGI